MELLSLFVKNKITLVYIQRFFKVIQETRSGFTGDTFAVKRLCNSSRAGFEMNASDVGGIEKLECFWGKRFCNCGKLTMIVLLLQIPKFV